MDAQDQTNVSVQVAGFIPARLASTRLPRKLLLTETGKPLIQHTWEAVSRAQSLAELVVVTDSSEIVTAVQAFGGRSELTGEHSSGTDRIAEVVRRHYPNVDIIINIQGDEPEMEAEHIDLLTRLLREHPRAEMATLATPIDTLEQHASPACVKVVCAPDGRALYFSRCPVPFCRDREVAEVLASESPWLQHLGIYAYRREFLLALTELPPSRLEQLEKLEQLRALEAGATIQVGIVKHAAVGIDTPDDYARFVNRVRQETGGQDH